MRLWSKPLVVAAAGMALVWLAGISIVDRASAQAKPGATALPTAGKTAGEAFKNVTTASLKGLTVDDFLGAMGVMAAALGYDCADCHPGAGSDKVDWVFDTPKKKTARKMVEMVANINRTNFAGAQAVTCFTCHHGRDLPTTTIALDTLYGPPNEEKRDIITRGEGQPAATEILDKYIAAMGGAQNWAKITSYVATGSSLGYEGLGGGGSFTIYAKAHNMRTVQIQFKDHPERGDSTRTYNGVEGWIKSPRSLLGEYQLTGSELEGAKLDAVLSFPPAIKTALTNFVVGVPDTLDDRAVYGSKDVWVVQGRGQKGLLATFYFDRNDYLLLREVRYSSSPIGRVPTQIDYSDYRSVAGGVKIPFKYTFSWLDGRDQFQLNDVKTNVAIDASKF